MKQITLQTFEIRKIKEALKNWEKEYIPPINKHWTLRKCMEHVEHKWLGMRMHVLRSYKLHIIGNSVCSNKHQSRLISPVTPHLKINSENCALCVCSCEHCSWVESHCDYCPLSLFSKVGCSCTDEWLLFVNGDIRPMLRLIKKVKKYVSDRDLTWDTMKNFA